MIAPIEVETGIDIQPLGDRVVIEPDKAVDVTPGGILLPEMAKEKPQQGTIVAVGAGRKDDNGKVIAMDVAVGDKVLYAKYAGTELKVNGKSVFILKESELFAIVRGKAK